MISLVCGTTACLSGSDTASNQAPVTAPGVSAESHANDTEAAPSRYPAPARLIGIGDVHGDLSAFRAALELAGVLGEGDTWTGGETVIVQTGDVLDRGDDEPEILALISTLETQAEAAGGKLIALNGNHETMNVATDLRYVTPDGFLDYAKTPVEPTNQSVEALPAENRGRAAAFAPGGPAALDLSNRNVVVVVGDTVFVHGGVLPEAAAMGLDHINSAARTWMAGDGPAPAFLTDPNGPVWSRHYSDATDSADCDLLTEALSTLNASRMVVGHTVQFEGITQACDKRVWRIDVGMAAAYGGRPEVLEIVGNQVRALTPDGPRDY